MADDDTSEPTLTEILSQVMEATRSGMDVSLPGIVRAFDPASQRASIQVAVMRPREGEDGSRIVKPRTLLADVPVVFYGSGDYYESFPLQVGATGTLLFCGQSIDRYKTVGGVVDPGDDRRHHAADAQFIPGGRPSPGRIRDFAADAWVISVPAGKQVRLGSSSASESAVLGDTYRTAEDAMLSALSAAWAVLITLPTNAVQILALGPTDAAAIAAFTTSIAAFQHASSDYLTTRVKLASQSGGGILGG